MPTDIEIHQAFYTRCAASFSVSGKEGLGWRWLSDGLNAARLDEYLPFMRYKAIGYDNYEPPSVELYLKIRGVHLLLRKSYNGYYSRGGVSFAHAVLTDNPNFSALDAVCNIANDNFWVEEDKKERDWPPPNEQHFRFYRTLKGKIFEHIKKDLKQVSNKYGAIRDLGDFKTAVISVLDWLVRTGGARPVILMSKSAQDIETAIQLIVYSLPDNCLRNVSYITLANWADLSLSPTPVIIGWLTQADGDKKELEKTLNQNRIGNYFCVNLNESLYDVASVAKTGGDIGFGRSILTLWENGESLDDLLRYINIVEKYGESSKIVKFIDYSAILTSDCDEIDPKCYQHFKDHFFKDHLGGENGTATPLMDTRFLLDILEVLGDKFYFFGRLQGFKNDFFHCLVSNRVTAVNHPDEVWRNFLANPDKLSELREYLRLRLRNPDVA